MTRYPSTAKLPAVPPIYLPALLASLLSLGVAAPAAGLEQGLSSGQLFPDMPFTRLTKNPDSNEAGSIADLRGKKLMIHVFASW